MAPTARPFGALDVMLVRRVELVPDPEAEGFAFFRPLHRYWEAQRGDRTAPRRADIDPLDLPLPLLPHVLLVDVSHDPLDFRYRLSGTAADTIHGQSLKGVRVADLQPEAFARVLQADLERMAADLAVQFVSHTFVNRQGSTRQFRVLRLPLIDDDGRLAMIMLLADHGALES